MRKLKRLAELYLYQEECWKAFFIIQLGLFFTWRRKSQYCYFLLLKGELYFLIGKGTEFFNIKKSVLSIARSRKFFLEEAYCLLMDAKVALNRSNFSEIEKHCRAAVNLISEKKDRMDSFDARILLIKLNLLLSCSYRLRGVCLDEARAIMARYIPLAEGYLKADCLLELGRILLLEKDHKAAISAIKSAITMIRKISFKVAECEQELDRIFKDMAESKESCQDGISFLAGLKNEPSFFREAASNRT